MSGVVLAALTVAALRSSDTSATSWTVLEDGSGDFPTIQAAVDFSSPGDSVLVGAGNFVESVAIDVPVSIIGTGAAHSSVLSAGGANSCLFTSTTVDPLIVESLFLLDASPGYPFVGGYVIEGDGKLLMSDCLVTDSGGHATRGVSWSGESHMIGCEFFNLSTENAPIVEGADLVVVEQCVFRDSHGTAIVTRGPECRVTGSLFTRLICDDGAAVGMHGPIVASNNVFLDLQQGAAFGPFDPPVRTRGHFTSVNGTRDILLDRNTFVRVDLGPLDLFDPVSVVSFSQNVITGGLLGVSLVGVSDFSAFSCNDVWNNDTNWIGPDQTGQNGNISMAPLYCDVAGGDFTVASNSPCLPANNPCGVLIGALGEGCGPTSVEQRSWGAIKALYR